MAFLTQEVFGYKLIEMFYTITGSMWNRTKGTQLPEAVQTTAEFLPGEGARRERGGNVLRLNRVTNKLE